MNKEETTNHVQKSIETDYEAALSAEKLLREAIAIQKEKMGTMEDVGDYLSICPRSNLSSVESHILGLLSVGGHQVTSH